MDYHINEGSFRIPQHVEDRSVNMLVLNHGPGGLTLVVTRDRLQEGEQLEGFISRQLRTLASQVKQFRQQDPAVLTVSPAQLPAIRVATSFKQNNASIHQLQTVVMLQGGAVLAFTLSCSSPLTAEQTAYAQELLDSFTPTARPAG